MSGNSISLDSNWNQVGWIQNVEMDGYRNNLLIFVKIIEYQNILEHFLVFLLVRVIINVSTTLEKTSKLDIAV